MFYLLMCVLCVIIYEEVSLAKATQLSPAIECHYMNMCPRICDKNNVRIVKLVMRYICIMVQRGLRKISRFTVYQLFWTAVCFVILLVICNWRSDRTAVEIQRPGVPVIVWWTPDFPGTSTTRHCSNGAQCNVFPSNNNTNINGVKAFLFYASNLNFSNLPLPRRAKDTIWGLYHEESPRNVEELLHEQTLRLFNYTATFSRYSDVPFPLQYLRTKEDITSTKFFVPTAQKNVHLNEIAPVMYLQTDCETSTERDTYVQELMKYINIDSYGACLKNKILPGKFTTDYLNNLYEEEFLKFIARYKFVVAIENGVCYDYITEKFWRPIAVGSVPIYFGSPSVRDWFPNAKSAILLEDFPSPQLMAGHLMKLLDNDTLYEEYVEHKTKEIITNQKLIEELRSKDYQLDTLKVVEKFECLICEKIYKTTKGKERGIVNVNHYNCPKPISALTLNVNPLNSWVHSWYRARTRAEEIYEKIMAI